ncbi:MAG: hypothetical protein NTZ61_03305 [Proteobacteria bacterium]|nr:hypothetical protein [Pseudomonadota bacterium]
MSADLLARAERRFTRGQLAIAALLALGIAGVLTRDVLRSPAVPFLARDDTPWIVARTPLQTDGMLIERAKPPTSFFERKFIAKPGATHVTLRVRALREVSLVLNGKELPLPRRDPDRWKDATLLDLTPHLVAGENVLFASVRNPAGNPALQLRIDGLEQTFITDQRWISAWQGDPVAYAVRAEDSIRHPESVELPAPPASLEAKAVPLLLLAAGGGALFWLLGRRPDAAHWAPAAALALVTLFWLLLFRRIAGTPADVGFDASAHIAYIEWILAHLAFVARSMARTLAPDAPWLAAGSTLMAGLLPMNVTLATCVSNEAPYALLASLALLATLRALLRERSSLRDDMLLGVVFGAAALTKYSILLWVPILLGTLAAKRWTVEGTRIARAAGGASLSLAITAVLAGWVYLRNYRLSGNPLVWNLNADPDNSWWQLPGFHSADYFLRFGDALTRPWFSSFHSFWDALYSTLWGNGLLSGVISPRLAVRDWNYEWMAAVFLLAVPATLLLALGWVCAVRAALRGSDRGRRLGYSLLVGLPPILLASIASVSLHYPFWSVAKSFYALALTPTLAVLTVLGFAALDRRLPNAIRALPFCWAAAFLGAIVWSQLG